MKFLAFVVAAVLVVGVGYSQTVTNTIRNCRLEEGFYVFEMWSQASQPGVVQSQGIFQFNVTYGALTTSGGRATFSSKYSVIGTPSLALVTSGGKQFFQIGFGTFGGPAPEITTTDGGELVFTASCRIVDPNVTAGLSWKVGNGWYWLTNVFVGGDDSPLPVQLSSFIVSTLNGSAALKWTTVSEVNNYGFAVQRGSSKDCLADADGGFLSGHGTTLLRHDYAWTDQDPVAYYRLRQIDLDGTSHFSDVITFTPTNVESSTSNPRTFSLGQNYPNPFNPSTTITYELPMSSEVRLSVHDMLGREVSLLVNESSDAGVHEARFDASGFSSGVYFYRLRAGDFVSMKQMLVLK